ncbi:hypothetical protein RhiirB3_427058 [Rhizophagus irregularis]|nr:hypothetical protein RhiirB3_427058 [Rhizophagus irregularis]
MIIQYNQPNETYLYNDIYNFIYNNGNGATKEKLFDAQYVVTLLEQHKIENNIFEYIVNNNTNEFESAIWMFPEQKMYYSRFFDIVFDNTYRTRFGEYVHKDENQKISNSKVEIYTDSLGVYNTWIQLFLDEELIWSTRRIWNANSLVLLENDIIMKEFNSDISWVNNESVAYNLKHFLEILPVMVLINKRNPEIYNRSICVRYNKTYENWIHNAAYEKLKENLEKTLYSE